MLIPYYSSYYHQSNKEVHNSDFVLIGPVSIIFEAISCLLTVSLSSRFLLYDQVLVGLFVSCAVIFCSSFIAQPFLFCVVYGFGLGWLSGLTFLPVLMILWNQFPEKSARNTGIALFGYMVGTAPFGVLFTLVVNPNNQPARLEDAEGEEQETFYPDSVARRVPMTLRVMVLALLVVGLAGLALVSRDKGENRKKESRRTLRLSQVVRDKEFWNLVVLMFNCFSGIGYVSLVYKIVGNLFIEDDYFTSFVGTVGFLVGGVGRITYGYLIENYEWKRVFGLTLSIYTLLSFSFWFTLESREIFGFYISFFTFLSSSFYTSIAIQCQRVYPNDNWIMSYIGIAFVPGYTIPYIFEKLVTPKIGYFWTMMIVALFPLISFFQVLFFPSKKSGVLISSDS
jgi:MFS family permease